MIKHVSNSQLKTHRACPRKWYLEKIEGRATPPGKAARLGVAIHSAIENYFKKGQPIPVDLVGRDKEVFPGAGRIATAIVPEILSAMDSPQSEVEFNLPFVDGLTLKGVIDLITPGHIGDIKTTSDINRYGLSEMEAELDSQANLYLWAAHQGAVPKANTFSFFYVQTRGGHKTKTVTVTLTDDDVTRRVAHLKEQAKLIQIHAESDRTDVPANINSCGDYGGCPHRTTCMMDGVFTPKNERENAMASFIEMLAAKRKAAAESESEKEQVEKPEVITPTALEINETLGTQIDVPPAPEPEPMPTETASAPINPPDRMPDEDEPDAPSKKRGRPSRWPDVPANFGGGSIGRMKKKDMAALYTLLKQSVAIHGDVRAMYQHLDFDPYAAPAGELRQRLSEFLKAIPQDLEKYEEPQNTVTSTEAIILSRDPDALRDMEALIEADDIAAEKPLIDPIEMEQTHDEAPQKTLYKKPQRVPVAQAESAEKEPTRLVPPSSNSEKEPGEVSSTKASTSRTLYVGCRPRNGNPTHLDTVLAKLRDQLTSARGRHWMCINEYGVAGKHLIAEALANIDNSELPAEIYADGRVPGHDEAVLVLATKNYEIIERG